MPQCRDSPPVTEEDRNAEADLLDRSVAGRFHCRARWRFAWSAPDEELLRFHNERTLELGAHLCGRRIYEPMVYWETAHEQPSISESELEFARLWKELPKIVFSGRSSGRGQLPACHRTARRRDRQAEGAAREGPGHRRRRPASAAMELGLIDEYGLFVSPVILGGGTPSSPPWTSGSTSSWSRRGRSLARRLPALPAGVTGRVLARTGNSVRIVIAIAAVLLAGCGSVVVDRDRTATPPYDGPLDAGAAVGALECDGKTPYQRGEGVYDDGLAKVQGSAEAALDDYMSESGLSFFAPSDAYAVEREQDGRVLFSYDVDGRTKVAMFAADDVRDWNRDEGWGVRAWAQCDPSELPPDVTDDLNIGVWEDESGRRVPVTRIQSFQGAEHCSWTDITFLLVGREEAADWYVRDTSGDFSRLLRTTFANEADAPRGCDRHGLAPRRPAALDRAGRGGGLPGEPQRCAGCRALAGGQAAHPVRVTTSARGRFRQCARGSARRSSASRPDRRRGRLPRAPAASLPGSPAPAPCRARSGTSDRRCRG